MISNFLKYAMIASLCATLFSCSEKTIENTPSSVTTEAKTTVTSDSTAKNEEEIVKAEKGKLPKPYHPEENAEEKIGDLVKQAQQENKNIMIQAGGNWCIWCLRFNNYVQTTPDLKRIIDENYLYYHLNYSPENKNEKVFAQYDNPGEKFGYPVFIVLDKNGKLIHTQDSAVLEDGDGYSLEKTRDFFKKWIPNS